MPMLLRLEREGGAVDDKNMKLKARCLRRGVQLFIGRHRLNRSLSVTRHEQCYGCCTFNDPPGSELVGDCPNSGT